MNPAWAAQYSLVIDQLKAEIEAYVNEEYMYKVLPGTTNSGGNLAMHLVGNLKHFYGSVLLEDGYERNREFEFGGKMSKADLLTGLAEAKITVLDFFESASDASFEETYPIKFLGRDITNGYAYLQFLSHFAYHLGQINYHRRYFLEATL